MTAGPVVQLALDLWPVTDGDDETGWEPLPYRHEPHDVADHQRGLCRVPWDTGSWKTGDLVPAWVCCRCGNAEPTQFTLEINHRCHTPYSACPPATRWPIVEAVGCG